ncbi:hypothetical protein [Acinetobacter larvae]|nr:hypothetical protein [Acinetobacter larvae]
MKKLMLLATLSTALTGCVVAPDAHSQPRYDDRPHQSHPSHYQHVPRHKTPPPAVRHHPKAPHYRHDYYRHDHHQQAVQRPPRPQYDQRWHKTQQHPDKRH